jgi:hypothetical protein
MSDNVIQFPRKPAPRPRVQAVSDSSTVEQLSEEFLKQAVSMHGGGASGVDVYRGMIMAVCKLICRSDDDPTVIDRRLAASHAHMLEARQIIAANGTH